MEIRDIPWNIYGALHRELLFPRFALLGEAASATLPQTEQECAKRSERLPRNTVYDSSLQPVFEHIHEEQSTAQARAAV